MQRFSLLDMDFLRFCARLLGRVAVLEWDALKGWGTVKAVVVNLLLLVGTGFGILGLASSLFGWWETLPWEAPATVLLLLFLYGLFRASYEIEQERDKLERQLEDEEKRAALLDLLGEAYKEGLSLKGPPKETAIKKWVDRTRNLIEAALDQGRAEIFMDNNGYKFVDLVGIMVDPATQLQWVRNPYWVEARLVRLKELIEELSRLEPLNIRRDFDPED